MTHTLDIGTDLDDLLATIGEPTIDTHDDTHDDTDHAATAVTPTDESASFLSPKVIRGAWYR